MLPQNICCVENEKQVIFALWENVKKMSENLENVEENKKIKTMQWTAIKEVIAMPEVLGKRILLHKPGTQERGQGWQKVDDTLNLIDGFIVTGQAVQDKIMALIKKHGPMINKEKTQTGIGGDEPSEFSVLEEIINIFDNTLQKCEEATEKEKEKEKSALEIRKLAMETMGQTPNRHKTGEKKERRAKRSSSDKKKKKN